jgi:hypothetical protein
LNNSFLLGFAAVCTAGILLPLHLTIGIRLAKEDEIEGLDLTSKISSLFMKIKKTKLLLVVAHGESWEVAASRAVSKLVKTILEESSYGREEARENGTFELHYTPTDVNEKSITVPLSTPNEIRHNQSTYSLENGGQQGITHKNILRF